MIQNKLWFRKGPDIRKITLGFIHMPEETLWTKELHIHVPVPPLKSVLQICALFLSTLLLSHSAETFDSPQSFYGNGTKLIANTGFQLVTGLKRMCKQFLFKTSPTRSSLEPLGQANAAAMTRRQIEI